MKICTYRNNTRINYCFEKLRYIEVSSTFVVMLKEIFDKSLKKVKITPYALTRLNTLNVPCHYNSRECLNIYPTKSAREITRFPSFNCVNKSIYIVNLFKAIG